MMFAVARKIPQATASMKAGRWEKKLFKGVEITGKTLGVVGLGNIGRTVASRGVGLKMRVIGFDPFLSSDSVLPQGVEVGSFEDVLAKADFLTLHLPLTEKTKYLIDKDAISRMKKGAYLINCARGGVVEEAALLEGLKSGHIAGAGMDVFETEPAKNLPFAELDNVVLSPHVGASTVEAQQKVAVELAEVFVEFFKAGKVRNAVNHLG